MLGNDPWLMLQDAQVNHDLLMYVIVRDVVIVLLSCVLGLLLGRSLRHWLQHYRFDSHFAFPWLNEPLPPPPPPPPRVEWEKPQPPPPPPRHAPQLSLAIGLGLALRFTIWAIGLASLAYLHGQTPFAVATTGILFSVWGLIALALASLWFSRQVTSGLLALLELPALKTRLESWMASETPDTNSEQSETTAPTPQPTETPSRNFDPQNIRQLLGIVVYATILSPLIMGGIEMLGSDATSSAFLEVWQFVFRLASAFVALLIGWVGLSLLKERRPQEGEKPRWLEQTLIVTVTVLSILILADGLSVFSTLFATATAGVGEVFVLLIALAVLVVGYQMRNELFDLWAGFLLRGQETKKIPFEGGVARIRRVRWLLTDLTMDNDDFQLRNSIVHKASREPIRPSQPLPPDEPPEDVREWSDPLPLSE